MNLRRTIAALGAAFALSFGLMLAPSQAEAATVVINPRANAVEAGQILAAPDGSVFTITVYDAGLEAGQKSVTHTFQTGNTLRQTANKIVQAINADTELQAIGVTATLQNGANYTIASTSTNGTLYKQTTTGGGTNRLAIQQTLTIGGTVTVDDKLTLTIYDAGLVGGKEAVVYKPNTGDTLADIVVRLRNKINNSTTLAALGISAKVSASDSSVLLIESPTFDTTEKFTSYSAKVKAGGTETMTLGAFWGTNGAQTLSVSGPITVGETVKFTVFNFDLPDLQKEVSYVTQAGDNLNMIRCGLRTEINNDADLAEIGVHATCGGGVINLTSTSPNPTTYFIFSGILCAPVNLIATQWPGVDQVKICGTAGASSAAIVRQTLEAIGDPNAAPQRIPAAANLLKANNALTFYVYRNHNEFYDSGAIAYLHPIGGPALAAVLAIENVRWANPPDLPNRKRILGYSFGGPSSIQLSLIFEDSTDRHEGAAPESNNFIQHATAHEAGHQYSILAGDLANSAAFQQAWNMDIAGMALASACKYEAPIANSTETTTRHGIFNSAVDANGQFICGADGEGESSTYGSDNLTILKAAYPYFDQPNLPLTEVFPEIFAFRAGFPDYIDTNGNEISGSNRVFQSSQALLCSQLYVNTWAEFGRNPNGSELQSAGYSFPAGTQTGFMFCDGTIEYTDNTGA